MVAFGGAKTGTSIETALMNATITRSHARRQSHDFIHAGRCGIRRQARKTAINAIDPCAGGTILPQTPDGTFFGAIGDEALTGVQTLPFTLDFYGDDVTQYYVSTNGWLSFNDPGGNAFPQSAVLPDPAAPSNLVAGFWDDWTLETTPAPTAFATSSSAVPTTRAGRCSWAARS